MTGTRDLDTPYAASYRRLVVHVYAICGDLADAEDAVQEAFVATLRRGRDLDGVANTDAWMRRVALNRLRSSWRHASVVRRYQAAVPGPQAPVEVGPEHVATVTALAQLDPHQRRVMVLPHLADLGTAQIADELSTPKEPSSPDSAGLAAGWPNYPTSRSHLMPDLKLLRDLGDEIHPPALDLLRETARRRNRRTAAFTVTACALPWSP
jgi:RNA polymerase sigma-70 factor (ECF subfamily)